MSRTPSRSRGRGRRAGLLLSSLLIVLTLVAPIAVGSRTPANAAVLGSGCGDLFVLGARGSDQPQAGVTTQGGKYDAGTGLGPQVYSVTTSLIAKVINPRVVVRQAVTYPAFQVPRSARPSSWQNFLAGINKGVGAVQTTLDQRASSCPNERIVLAGYSAGAMVMHRVVRWLTTTGRTAILNRMAGAILIADGDRVVRDNHTRYGSAGETFGGVAYELGAASSARFPTGLKPRVHSICNARDAVCDFTGTFLNGTGIGIHTAYTNTPPLTAAATAVANTVLHWPIAAPKNQAVQAQAGHPRRYVLTGDTGPLALPLRWRVPAPAALPAGLTLSSNGTLTGTPTTVGQVRVPVQVRSATTGLFSAWIAGGTLTITTTSGPPVPTPPPPSAATVTVWPTVALPQGFTIRVSQGSTPCPAGTYNFVSNLGRDSRTTGLVDTAGRFPDFYVSTVSGYAQSPDPETGIVAMPGVTKPLSLRCVDASGAELFRYADTDVVTTDSLPIRVTVTAVGASSYRIQASEVAPCPTDASIQVFGQPSSVLTMDVSAFTADGVNQFHPSVSGTVAADGHFAPLTMTVPNYGPGTNYAMQARCAGTHDFPMVELRPA